MKIFTYINAGFKSNKRLGFFFSGIMALVSLSYFFMWFLFNAKISSSMPLIIILLLTGLLLLALMGRDELKEKENSKEKT